MKEIKAYVRVNMIDRVVRALEGAGVSNMTVIDVKAIWRDMRPNDLLYSLELAGQQNRRLRIVFVLTTAYLVVEVVASLLTGSLALLADAGHMLADVGGLCGEAGHLAVPPGGPGGEVRDEARHPPARRAAPRQPGEPILRGREPSTMGLDMCQRPIHKGQP